MASKDEEEEEEEEELEEEEGQKPALKKDRKTDPNWLGRKPKVGGGCVCVCVCTNNPSVITVFF